jgi:hypothetical protein
MDTWCREQKLPGWDGHVVPKHAYHPQFDFRFLPFDGKKEGNPHPERQNRSTGFLLAWRGILEGDFTVRRPVLGFIIRRVKERFG